MSNGRTTPKASFAFSAAVCLMGACVTDAREPTQDEPGAATSSVQSRGLVCQAPTQVQGFRFPYRSQARIHAGFATQSMVVKVEYWNDATQQYSAPSTYWDSSWAQTQDEQLRSLITPTDFDDCRAYPPGRGFGCTLNEFVARSGRYRFTAQIQDSQGNGDSCQWETTFTAPSAPITSRQTIDGRDGQLLTRTVDGSEVRIVHLYGGPRRRGFDHGYLLATEIVSNAEKLITWGYRDDGSLGVVDFMDVNGNPEDVICYDHSGIYGQPTIRTILGSRIQFPRVLRRELEGVLAGVRAYYADHGLSGPTLSLRQTTRGDGTELCPAGNVNFELADLIALNTLDDFCKSFSIEGDRVIDAGPSSSAGRIVGSTMEWTADLLGHSNYLFVHHAIRGTFVHSSWAGFLVAYGPLLNASGVVTGGIMSNKGRLPFGRSAGYDGEYWYDRLSSDPSLTKRSFSAEIREGIIGATSAEGLRARVLAAVSPLEFYTNHSTIITDATSNGDVTKVIETHHVDGVHLRGIGDANLGSTMALEYYGSTTYPEQDFIAATWCGQFLHCATDYGDDCAAHCTDGNARDDDYDRLAVQLHAADKIALATARRILQDAATEPTLLQFVLVLPATKEMLLGYSRFEGATFSHGGVRGNQVLLTWQQMTQTQH